MAEKEPKMHYTTTFGYMACGRYFRYIENETRNKRRVTCKVCKRTKEFRGITGE